MWKCRHCKQEFDFPRTTEKANHARHCPENQNRENVNRKVSEAMHKRLNSLLGERQLLDFVCANPNCGVSFQVPGRTGSTWSNRPRYCTRACASTVGGKAKAEIHHHDGVASYTTVAWRHHEKKCVVCGEQRIVAVHHYNGDHKDNSPQNLVPMCPTHHQYMHSSYKDEFRPLVEEYIKNKWG